MEKFSTPESQNTELLYEELRQRLEYGGDRIEWWQAMFEALQEAKQYLTDQNLIAEIDIFLSEYEDLTRYIRKDQKSMQAALRTVNVIANKVMEAIKGS
jgi:hypothetical protein